MDNNKLLTQAEPYDAGWEWLISDNAPLPQARPEPFPVAAISQNPQDRRHALSIFVIASRAHVDMPYIIARIVDVAKTMPLPFEIIVIDDAFYQNTYDYLEGMGRIVPVKIVKRKNGRSSLGTLTADDLKEATGDILVLFDADLRYSSEALLPLYNALQSVDIAYADPSLRSLPWIRSIQRVVQSIASIPFAPLLFNVPKNGLWAMRWSALEKLQSDPRFRPTLSAVTQLSFRASHLGLVLRRVDTTMASELWMGWTWLAFLKRTIIASEILVLRGINWCRTMFPFLFPPSPQELTETGFDNVKDYLYLQHAESAKLHLTKENITLISYLLFCGTAVIGMAHQLTGISVFTILVGLSTWMYLSLLILKVYVMYRAIRQPIPPCPAEELAALNHDELPVISVLIPLYKEREILPQIIKRISDFDYPTDKLDVIFIFESTDTETIEAFKASKAPPHLKALLSPDIGPKTKPKALNVAIRKSHGDVVVIYDAEILPDVDQLKKAALAFKKHPDAMYLHSRMNVYNADYNWLTRFYDGEFAFFYDFFLPGLVNMNIPLPISGHSTFFRRKVIDDVKGWDPYNVAEDCDIGIRLYRHGFKSGMMLDSFSWEQSTTTVPRWVRQRTRWVQGFIQTSLVHLRYPLLLKQTLGSWWNFLWFLILVPGNVILNLLNIVHWLLLILWLATHSPYIQQLYPIETLYAGTISFIIGNYLFMLLQMVGLYSRKHYGSVKNSLFAFIYWILLAIATVRATLRYIFRPYYWEKTQHFSTSTPAPSSPGTFVPTAVATSNSSSTSSS